jgi:hypothetical protein
VAEFSAPDDAPVASAPIPHSAILDKHIARYTAMEFSRQRMLEQLLTARWPLEQLRPRFPEFPLSAFRYPEAVPQPVVGPVVNKGRGVIATRGAIQAAGELAASLPTRNQSGSQARSAATGSSAHDAISFQYVPLIQCSFPHADPKEATSFTRKNGWLELTLGTTRPDAGLPYGVPARLLTIYCTSEAVRTNSPEIFLGNSVHDFLRRLDVPITRGPRGSLSVYANQLLRLIRSTLTIDENIKDGGGRAGLHIRQALFVEEAQLWWDEPDGKLGQGSSLALSTVLFHSILERSAPLATHAIKQLRKSPMDLDVYAWLVHRLFHLQKPSMVAWQQLSEQFGHNYREARTFRRFFLDSLKRVSAVYPEAKLNVTSAGVLLLPSRPHLASTKTLGKR